MIQIYSPGNNNFSKNGDMVLLPTECTSSAVLLGTWELTMSHPKDPDGRWKYIKDGAVISAPSFMGKNQLYRIYETDRNNDDISVSARPVFFDSANEVLLLDNRPTTKTGQAALNWIMSGTKYTGESDITTVSSAYYVRKNLMEALNGEDENSFIHRWGGEPLYQNFHVIFNKRAGSDNGLQVRYGKNIASIQETVNSDELVTRIIPVAFNGRMLAGSAPWVDSPLINSYPIVHAREIKYENIKLRSDLDSDPGDDDIVCESLEELRTKLTEKAQAEFTSGIDKPSVTLDIDMVDLAQTDEYKDYAILETVRLGDTVHCIHHELGINTSARVIEMEWDCIHDCVSRVVIGDAQYDYFADSLADYSALESIKGVVNQNGDIMADRIAGVLNMQRTNLRFQQDVAQHQTVRAILFEDLDPDSPTFGALCLGTQGLEISRKRNAYNTDWVWGTAIDSKAVHAEYMIAGILSDKLGNNYWDLDSGVFSFSSSSLIDGQSGNTVSAMQTKISANGEAISTEVTNRTNADSALSSRITQNANSITSEVTNRKNADSDLSTRITQNADAITSEATSRINSDSLLSSRITQTANSITSEVTNRKNADTALSSRITQNATAIQSRVTSEQAESIIEQKADSIRLKADKLAWSSTNSSLTEDGTLTVNKGTFKAKLESPTGVLGGWTLAANRMYNIGRVQGYDEDNKLIFDHTYTAELRGYNYSNARYLMVVTDRDEIKGSTSMPFVITYDGKIMASKGKIGSFSIDNSADPHLNDGIYTGSFSYFRPIDDGAEDIIPFTTGTWIGSNGLTVTDGSGSTGDHVMLTKAGVIEVSKSAHIGGVSIESDDYSVFPSGLKIADDNQSSSTCYIKADRNGMEFSINAGIKLTSQYITTNIQGNSITMTDSSSSQQVVDIGDMGISTTRPISCASINTTDPKSRVVETEDYSVRKLYCYEMPSPMFGDIGDGIIGQDGSCYISIDPVFAQTVGTTEYQVFLQAYGDGKCYVKNRNQAGFVVAGTPGMAFGWEIKAKQVDFDQNRFDIFGKPLDTSTYNYGADAADFVTTTDYGAQALEYIKEIESERRAS